MAVIKTFNTPYGVDATYHKIRKVVLDATGYNTVDIEVAVYHSKQSHDDGKEPMLIKHVVIPFNRFKSDPRQAFYNVLEQAPFSYLEGGETSTSGTIDLPNSLIPMTQEEIQASLPPMNILPQPPLPTPIV